VAPLHQLERGSTFAGRYEVIEELGKGGMGRVYKVFDKKIKEAVAMKLLKPEIAADEKTIERFSNELKFARKISHRRVCRMYDLGQEGTTFFITMEYVPGEDLKSFIKRSGHLTETKAVSVAKQICEGLAEAHHLGVLHRDLKPQNIMIDRDGNARIMDFGIARSLQAQGITGSGVLIGTPEYMSPEQAEAENVDQRSDIYSLGVILYEMVTGRVPFVGETPLSIALKHISAIPKDPRDVNTLVSEDLNRLILKCLEKSKEKRFQSAAELLGELEKIGQGVPAPEKVAGESKPITSREITVKFNLSRVYKPALILAVVVLVGFVVWGLLPRGKKDDHLSRPIFEAPPRPLPPSATPPKSEMQREFEKLIAGLAKESGQGAEGLKGSGRFFEWLMKEAAKYMSEQDYEEAKKVMETIKGKIPAESRLMAMWNEADAKIREAERERAAGKTQESHKNYEEGQTQMRKLLALVEEKEKADAARTDMEQGKERAAVDLPGGKDNLLFRIARAREKDASDAYNKDDFSGAKTLYSILGKIYGLSLQAVDDESGLRALKDYVKELRMEADSLKAAQRAPWHYAEAGKEEARAQTLLATKNYAAAAESYIQAAFLYEKAKEKTSETPPTEPAA